MGIRYVPKHSRVKRALSNFDSDEIFEHEIILNEEKRLDYNQAYDWAIDHFGPPGTTWDFYYVKNKELFSRMNSNGINLGWNDVFGFHDGKLAALFILRWK